MKTARVGVSALALMGAVPAWAQDTETSDDDDVSVIIVEGTKDVASSVFEYSGAVTAIAARELEQRQFRDLSSLTYAAPNVSLDTVGTFKGVANFAIRGIGVNSSIPSVDPAVGLFVDGVYMGVNAGSVFDTLDLAQIDILRGPQGVSFGQNTTGGAVMITTADPTDYWTGYARLSYEGPVDGGRGTGMFSGRGVVSGPLSDTVSIRMGILHSDDGGYFTNQFDGESYGSDETTVLRGAIKAELSERLTIVGKLEWTDSYGDGSPTHNNGLFARDTFEISINEHGFHDSENLLATLRTEFTVGSGTLTNIFGWRDYDLLTRNDIDSSPTPIFASDTETRQEQWSNELTYSVGNGPLRVIGGTYIFHQKVGYDEARDLSFFGAGPQYGGGMQEHDVYGLFGQIDIDLNSFFSLKAGLRWSREEKDAVVTYVRTRDECSVIERTCPYTGERVPGETNGFTDKRSWDNVSPRVVATWRATEDTRIYASWSRGFRSGGYNFRITQPDAFEDVAAMLGSPAFDRERVDTFEVGTKWQSPDRLLFLQGTLFWSEVDNLQREVVVPSLTAGLAQSIFNTADARIRGLELDASLQPADGLSLSANFGLTEADYQEVFFDLSGDGVIDDADLALELPRAPKLTWGATANYEVQLSRSKVLSANVYFQHRDRYAYSDNNWGFNYGSERLDASISVSCLECGVTLTLFGRNLLDEVQFGADAGLPFAGGPFSNGVNAPFDPSPAAGTFSPINKGRTLGVELGVEF